MLATTEKIPVHSRCGNEALCKALLAIATLHGEVDRDKDREKEREGKIKTKAVGSGLNCRRGSKVSIIVAFLHNN